MADSNNERPDFAVSYINGDWDDVTYTENTHIDNLMDAVIGLGAEVWAIKRRAMVVEKVLEEEGNARLREKIEAYVPTQDERDAWAVERDDFVSRIYSVLARAPKQTSGDNPTGKVSPIDRM